MSYSGALLFNVDGPMSPPPPFGSIRAGFFLQRFPELVQRSGGSYRSILERSDIDPVAANDTEYPLDGRLTSGLLENCCSLLNDSLFGFHLADFQDEGTLGCLGVLARSAPTLRVALQSMIDFIPTFQSPGADAELAVSGSVAEYRWRPYADFSFSEQATHHGMMTMAKLLAKLGGRDFHLQYAMTVTDMRRSRAAAERYMGCMVHGNAPANVLAFDAARLDRPLDSANPVVFGLVNGYLSRREWLTSPSLVEQVGAYVNSTLRSGACTIDHCAPRLRTSVRTLQKRLAESGFAFSDVVDRERFKAAKDALLRTYLTLDEIADSLGYAEKSSFSRAFKRWSGISPQAFRERDRQQGRC